MTKTAVVILNWNGKEWLRQFLPSVTQYSLSVAEVWVVDNASTDGSVEWLKENYPSVRILCLEKNWGFAGGYNRALEKIQATYYILLNSDVEVTKDWIQPIIRYLDEHPSVGAMQPKIRSYYQPEMFEYAGAAGGFMDKWGYMFCRGRIFSETEADTGQYDDITDIFWASGAALFVRADLFKQAGALDEDLFAHMEEIDLCWRIQHLGYRIVYHPDSCVYHVGGGTLSMGSPMKTYLNFRNNLILITKNRYGSFLFFIITGRLILDGIAAFSFLKKKNGWQQLAAIFKAHISFYRQLPATLRKRKQQKKKNSNCIYKGSIVYDFHVRGLKEFRLLESKFTQTETRNT